MNNVNQQYLTQGIFNFLEMQNTGALLVTGTWGCGKSYYFENALFGELRDKGYKPVRVSLFGMSDLNDLSKNIICENVQYFSDKKWVNESLKFTGNLVKHIKDIPLISDYVDVKSIWGQGKALYKLVPEKAVICLDDLERAVEKFDINDLLGLINDLVENQHLKVIVIANKEYLDEKSDKDAAHEIFYEKVIEKTLHFEPCISEVFDVLVNIGSEQFRNFMKQELIKNCVNPMLAKLKRVKRQKENIRTLKFAISHFKVLFDDYAKKGIDLTEEKTNKMLVNQWMFVYAIALESKSGKLSVDDCMGLDNYVFTSRIDSIHWGDEDYNGNLFGDEEKDNETTKVNIGERFVNDYYGNKAVEYVFYPDLYRFVLGGINYDFEGHLTYTNEAFKRFDYKANSAQEELGKWMSGYWKMTDKEAAYSLQKLFDYVENGELTDIISYYNASIFLLKYCGLIKKSTNEILAIFDVGLKKFTSTITLNNYLLSAINMLPVEKEEPVGNVYSMILNVIKERRNEQEQHDVDEMKRLFDRDINAFVKLFVPEDHSTPKFFNVPILHLLSEDDTKNTVSKAQPNDIMKLFFLIGFRYNNNTIANLKEEISFIINLKKVVKAMSNDKTKLSSMIIQDQLLPELEKVESRMISLQNGA